jgi:hypothetical protein
MKLKAGLNWRQESRRPKISLLIQTKRERQANYQLN